MGQLNICDKLEGFFQLSGHFLAKNWVNSRKLNAVAHLAVVVVTKGGYNTPTVSFLVATV